MRTGKTGAGCGGCGGVTRGGMVGVIGWIIVLLQAGEVSHFLSCSVVDTLPWYPWYGCALEGQVLCWVSLPSWVELGAWGGS